MINAMVHGRWSWGHRRWSVGGRPSLVGHGRRALVVLLATVLSAGAVHARTTTRIQTTEVIEAGFAQITEAQRDPYSKLCVPLCISSVSRDEPLWFVSWLQQGTKTPTAKPTTRKPAPPPARKPTVAPAEMTCPSPLGAGIKTKREYCDVLTGRDPKEGILIKLPPHRGPVMLKFNLHNRHTYSEEEVKMKRGFASYTAGIGVLTLDNTLLQRAAVATEFRTAADLVERISGGAGPGGVKAVAPVGTEAISVEIPAELNEVTILGEKLMVVRIDGQPANYTAAGRPIAIISDVTVEYTPAPAPSRRAK